MRGSNELLASLKELAQEVQVDDAFGDVMVPFCSLCCQESGGGIGTPPNLVLA